MRPLRTTRTYWRAFGPVGLLHLLHCLVSSRRKLVPVARRWARHPLYLRLNTSDVAVFRQVFLEQEKSAENIGFVNWLIVLLML